MQQPLLSIEILLLITVSLIIIIIIIIIITDFITFHGWLFRAIMNKNVIKILNIKK